MTVWRPTLRSRDVLPWTVALIAASGCVRLGLWQLRRLAQRREHNAAIETRRAAPLVDLTGRLTTADVAERRVHARGLYDYGHERAWPARTWEGVPGVAILTPLLLSDGSAVFVDRGWAPSPDAFHVDFSRYRERDSVDVQGWAFALPRDRMDVDPARLADSVPYPILPFVLQAAPGAPGPLRRWPLAVLTNGPHLSYAIQWFSFAVIILVGTIALLGKRAIARYESGGTGVA